jgi:hypothetical protein
MRRKKVKESMNIATVVSFDGSLQSASKIVLVQSSGLTVTVTTMGRITEDGTTFIPSLDLRRMLRINGTKATEEHKENGNEKV